MLSINHSCELHLSFIDFQLLHLQNVPERGHTFLSTPRPKQPIIPVGYYFLFSFPPYSLPSSLQLGLTASGISLLLLPYLLPKTALSYPQTNTSSSRSSTEVILVSPVELIRNLLSALPIPLLHLASLQHPLRKYENHPAKRDGAG